jgi:catechol-2,3-dioxygenase
MIREVEMYSDCIQDLKEFYMDSLKLTAFKESLISFSVKVGESIISFNECKQSIKPLYHFAFNIPENKIDEAIRWITPKAPLIHNEGKQIVHFEDWNAHSIYFNDPAGNIVEFIARHNLNNSTEELFSQTSLLCVSEIGLPVDSVEDTVHKLSQIGIIPWQKYNNNFAAIGDENGLFIVVNAGRVWFMSDKKSYPYDLTIKTDRCQITFDAFNGMNVKIL